MEVTNPTKETIEKINKRQMKAVKTALGLKTTGGSRNTLLSFMFKIHTYETVRTIRGINMARNHSQRGKDQSCKQIRTAWDEKDFDNKGTRSEAKKIWLEHQQEIRNLSKNQTK